MEFPHCAGRRRDAAKVTDRELTGSPALSEKVAKSGYPADLAAPAAQPPARRPVPHGKVRPLIPIVDLEAGKSSCQLGRSLLVADKLGLNLVDVLRQLQAKRPAETDDVDIPDSDEELDAPPAPGGPR